METNDIEVDESIPASRKLQADDARTLLGDAERMIACKGKKVAEFTLADGIPEEAVTAMLGPTGNLRSPTIRLDRLLIVGYNDDVFSSVFS